MRSGSHRTRNRILIQAIIALVIASTIMSLSSSHNVRATNQSSTGTNNSVRIWLNGDIIGAHPGWNNTSPGPTITVTSGETVQLFLNATDTQLHSWFIDSNQNFTPDPNGISSPDFSLSTTKTLNFTFTPIIGKNIPAAGNWTYRCAYHPFPYMYGTIRIEPAQVPDFQISPTPASTTILAGQTGNSTITVQPINGFTGTLTLSTTSPSPSIACSLNSTSITIPSTTAALLTCKGNAGTYPIQITATNASVIRTTTATFTIQDFLLTTNNPIVTVEANGQTATVAAVEPLEGFNRTISISVTYPAGITVTPSTANIPNGAGFSTLMINTTTAGNYTITATATTGRLSHSIELAIMVQDFSITSDPTTATITAGQDSLSTLQISTVNNFGETIHLTSNSTYCDISPVDITGPDNSTLTCNFPIPGAYHINVTATSGTLSHSLIIRYLPPSISQAPPTSLPDWLPITAIATAAIIASAIGVLFLRRRRTLTEGPVQP